MRSNDNNIITTHYTRRHTLKWNPFSIRGIRLSVSLYVTSRGLFHSSDLLKGLKGYRTFYTIGREIECF